MELLAIFLVIAGAVFTIWKIINSHKDKVAKNVSQVKAAKSELLQINENFENLLEKLDSRFTDEYLAKLENDLIDIEFSSLQSRLKFVRAFGVTNDLERKMFLDKLVGEIEKQKDFYIQIEKIIQGKKDIIRTANQLLSSKVVDGYFQPIDESLSAN